MNPAAATYSEAKNDISITKPTRKANADQRMRRARWVYSDVRLTCSARRGSSSERRCSISSRIRCSSGDNGIGGRVPPGGLVGERVGSIIGMAFPYREPRTLHVLPPVGRAAAFAASVEERRRHRASQAEPFVDPIDGALDVAPALAAEERQLLLSGSEESGGRDAEGTSPPPGAWESAEHLGRVVVQVSGDVRRRVGRSRTRQRVEVRQPHLERHGPRAIPVLAQPRADLLRQREDLAQKLLVIVKIAIERLLVAHRLRRLVCDDASRVDAAGKIVEIRRLLFADEAGEHGGGGGGGGGGGADAPRARGGP